MVASTSRTPKLLGGALLLLAVGVLYAHWSSKRHHRWDTKPLALAFEQELTFEPSLFAPGSVVDGMDQRDSALSSDGRHFLYTLGTLTGSAILHAKKKKGPWLTPRIASFCVVPGVKQRDLEPAFLPGTLDLYFASDRPMPGEEECSDFNLWRTTWTGERWVTPEPVPGVNEEGHEFYPSLSTDGTLYFTARRTDGVGGEDLWMARPTAEGFEAPVLVPGALNTETDEFNAAVHPDGKLIAFGSARPDGLGGGDLYFSRLRADGTWSEGYLAPEPINSPQLDFCPFFQQDSDVLWFTSNRKDEGISREGLDLGELQALWANQTSGGQDLYRVRYDRNALFANPPATTTPEILDTPSAEVIPSFPPQQQVEEIAKQYFAKYLAQEYEAMLPLMATDAIFEDPTMSLFGAPFRKEGADAIVQWLLEVGSGVEKVEFLIDHEFVTGSYLVMEGVYRTTSWGTAIGYPDLHLTVEHRGVTTLKVVDGKVASHHDWIDYEEMWRQIDAALAAQED